MPASKPTPHAAIDEAELHSDVAILGGGMVGLSLAILLAQALPHRRITLVESLPYPAAGGSDQPMFQPSFDARSSAIAWGSQSIFSAMAVWPALQQHLTPIATVHVSDKGHVGGCRMQAQEYGVPALGFVVDNAWLGACLLARAQQFTNLTINAPASVKALAPRRGGYGLQLENQGQVVDHNTRLAVIADGAQSGLRQRLGIASQVTDYQHHALIANVAFTQPHQGVAYERFTATGPVAVLPRAKQEGALIWTLPSEQAEAVAEQGDDTLLAQLQTAFGQRLGRFTRIGQRTLYPLQLTQAKEQVRPHLVVMGNAAHSLHPVAGQGFNLSLRDCQSLATSLAKHDAGDDQFAQLCALQAYQSQQQADQWLTTQFSDQLPRWFSNPGLAQAAVRGAGLLALELVPAGKRRLAKQSMGLGGRL
ncbi:2-octaprenyl-6-methoxyphenyl hydroxylase [Halioxenophilus aromaticivorans]|uniref:2-octaprenyl-6-methoxyphenyl hydroxylase n=1 Tax=Halioxenophilus aromaticivorans TaxID=1306992 RepID=A0AAV3U5W9_9ALTE